MTPEQAAAFVQSQTACAIAEIEAMKAENQGRIANGYSLAHDEGSFRSIPDEFGIGYNDVVKLFQDSNSL